MYKLIATSLLLITSLTFSPEKAIKDHFLQWIELVNKNPKATYEKYIWQSPYEDEKTEYSGDNNSRKVSVDPNTIAIKWSKQDEEYFFRLTCKITIDTVHANHEVWGILTSENCKFLTKTGHEWETYADLMRGNTMGNLY